MRRMSDEQKELAPRMDLAAQSKEEKKKKNKGEALSVFH